MPQNNILSNQKKEKFDERPKTLADLERKTTKRNQNNKGQIATQIISFGSTRYECRKLEYEIKDLERIYESKMNGSAGLMLEKKAEERIRQHLRNLKDAVGEGEENRKIMMGFLNNFLTTERCNFNLFRSIIQDFASTELGYPFQIACSRDGHSAQEDKYIKRQASLFEQSFERLYRDYPEQYVLFHEGEVLYSSDTVDNIAKNAFKIRKVKEVFIKKVSFEEDTIEVLTSLG